MQDEGVIYVAGHPLLNRRCTRLTGFILLRNNLGYVRLGAKQTMSLTLSWLLLTMNYWQNFEQSPSAGLRFPASF